MPPTPATETISADGVAEATPTATLRAARATRTPHRWRNLVTLTGVTVIDNAESGLTETLFPAIAQALQLSNSHLGILSAVGKLAAMPFGPGWVWLASRTSRRFVLSMTTALAGAFGIAAGFSQGFAMLLVFNVLMSVVLVGGHPIANAVISDSFDDRNRGKAVGLFYGGIALCSAMLGPLIAQFTHLEDGWRWGMWVLGALCFLASAAVFVFFKDPGVGASEPQLVDLTAEQRASRRPTLRAVMSLFRTPTFTIMLLSRLLSGHLLIIVFGVQFLVTERGFSTAVAAIVLLPFGVSYLVGTVGGGMIASLLDRVVRDRGRVIILQTAQIMFAVAAFFGTQFDYANIGIYAAFWAVLGFSQGLNPGVNRPIIMAVTLPELRGQALAIYLTIFEAIGWAIFTLTAGALADLVGLQAVFLWLMVALMLVNAVVLTSLYFTYPRDVRRVDAILEQRRQEQIG